MLAGWAGVATCTFQAARTPLPARCNSSSTATLASTVNLAHPQFTLPITADYLALDPTLVPPLEQLTPAGAETC